jgi:hypothetical protein
MLGLMGMLSELKILISVSTVLYVGPKVIM